MDDGLPDLVERHWQEVGVYRDLMPLSVDWDQYLALADKGILRVVGARLRGDLIGYASYMVMPHIHYSATMHIMGDGIFVTKDHRASGAGVSMIDKAERDIPAEFAGRWVRIWYHDKAFLEYLGPVLKKRGYSHVENCWDKMVRG